MTRTSTSTSTSTSAADTPTTAPGFEFFQGNETESRSQPQITVRKGGLMVLTRAAVDLLGENVSHVQLAYNAKTGAVGIRAATEDAPGCYLLRAQRKSPSRLVGGKRFFKHHGLTVDEARSYNVEDFGNGIVGFPLAGVAGQDDEAEAETASEVVTTAPTETKPTKATGRRKIKAAA